MLSKKYVCLSLSHALALSYIPADLQAKEKRVQAALLTANDTVHRGFSFRRRFSSRTAKLPTNEVKVLI